MSKQGYIYLMVNNAGTVIYTGVTSDLKKRVYEHKEGLVDSFTKKYKTHHLAYYEIFDDIKDAIVREKQIKGGSRKKKVALIQVMNPGFKDLYDQL